MGKIVLDDTVSGFKMTTINSNFEKIQNALDNEVLYRDNPTGEPNQMNNALDMNSQRILNVGAPVSPTDAARLGDIPFEPIPIGTTTALLTTFTPTGSLTSTNVQAAIPEAMADVLSEIANTSDAAKGDDLVGVKRNTVATTLHDVIAASVFNLKTDAGAVGDGVTNDRAALALAESSATGEAIYLPAGLYRINSDITITSTLVFTRGARLMPASGVTITLNAPVQAGAYQIFDLSLGGTVRPVVTTECHVNWWGAVADDTTDSAPALQAALDAMIAPGGGGSGGILKATSGTYRLGSMVTIANNTSIVGTGRYTVWKATAGFSDVSMFRFVNGTSSQFNCRLEYGTVDGNDKAFSNGMIHASSWNETCGIKNLVLINFRTKGLVVSDFYGGSAASTIQHVEVFPSASTGAGTIGVQIVAPASVGYFGIQIDNMTFAAPGAAANCVGLHVENKVAVDSRMLHFEDSAAGIVLYTDARMAVNGKLTGNPNCVDLISIGSSFTGNLIVNCFALGGATRFLKDNRAAAYTVFETEPLVRPFMFPPEPGQVLASARCVGGASASINTGNGWAKGISAVTRLLAGSYRFTLSPSFGAAERISGWVCTHDNVFKCGEVIRQTSNTFDVKTYDTTGTLVETNDFTVYITHKP